MGLSHFVTLSWGMRGETEFPAEARNTISGTLQISQGTAPLGLRNEDGQNTRTSGEQPNPPCLVG